MSTSCSLKIPPVKVRDPYVDILKGIGIISIVVGHSGPVFVPIINFAIIDFVYSYHIMLFMFVLGFLFNKDKAVPPYQYIGKTVFSQGKNFLLYSTIFISLHNVFLKWNFIVGDVYDFKTVVSKILRAITLNCDETLLGALWFVPVYIFTAIGFSVLFNLAEKTKIPNIMHVVFMLAVMVIGITVNHAGDWYPYHTQTSFLAIPVCYFGYFAKKYWNHVNKFITWYGGIIAAVALYLLITSGIGKIELSVNMILSPYLFYPATLLGIYYCLALAKVIKTFKYTRVTVSHIGKNSFHIMAMHFAVIKAVDNIYGIITKQDISVITKFPYAFDLWNVYYPLGILVPVFIVFLINQAKKYSIVGFEKIKSIKKYDKAEN